MKHNDLFVRPTYRQYGVYEKTGENRARVIFEGTRQECYDKIKELTNGDTLRIIVVQPFKKPYLSRIGKSLESMQSVVRGYIQAIYPFDDEEIALVCNEEGKIDHLTPNRFLFDEYGEPYELICGTFFLCSAPIDSEEFEDIPDHLIKKYIDMFSRKEP